MLLAKTESRLDIRKNLYSQWVVSKWNKLPQTAIDAPSLLSFNDNYLTCVFKWVQWDPFNPATPLLDLHRHDGEVWPSRYIQGISHSIMYWFISDPQEDDKILAEGVAKFCEDLNLDPASRPVLIIAWKFKAATQCEFTRKEFTDGMTELGWDSINAMISLVVAEVFSVESQNGIKPA